MLENQQNKDKFFNKEKNKWNIILNSKENKKPKYNTDSINLNLLNLKYIFHQILEKIIKNNPEIAIEKLQLHLIHL